MADRCCGSANLNAGSGGLRWRRVLWIALLVNATMFLVEIVAGGRAQSRALQADALDFLGDAANYAISLGVAGMALAWRARAALIKGVSLAMLGAWVLGSTIWAALAGTSPEPMTMGLIGMLALVTNVLVAAILYRYRAGDANMQSVWICSRNDALGTVAVVAAAAGVFGTGTAWPDLMVAAILAVLGLSGGWQIFKQARRELAQTSGLHLRAAR